MARQNDSNDNDNIPENNLLPKCNTEYDSLQYWNKRYTEQESYDWFKGWSSMHEEICGLLPEKTNAIVNIGCGNSTLSSELYVLGYRNVINVDYSPVVIEAMALRHAQQPESRWIVGDMFHLSDVIDMSSAHCCIDKGTLDAVLTVQHDPWDPPVELLQRIHSYMQQVCRILVPGGRFLHITFAQPHFRSRFIEIPGFKVNVHKLGATGGSFEYFCYEGLKI